MFHGFHKNIKQNNRFQNYYSTFDQIYIEREIFHQPKTVLQVTLKMERNLPAPWI